MSSLESITRALQELTESERQRKESGNPAAIPLPQSIPITEFYVSPEVEAFLQRIQEYRERTRYVRVGEYS